MEVITVFILLLLLPTIKDLIHWFIPVGIRVRISEFGVDYGVSLAFP